MGKWLRDETKLYKMKIVYDYAHSVVLCCLRICFKWFSNYWIWKYSFLAEFEELRYTIKALFSTLTWGQTCYKLTKSSLSFKLLALSPPPPPSPFQKSKQRNKQKGLQNLGVPLMVKTTVNLSLRKLGLQCADLLNKCGIW